MSSAAEFRAEAAKRILIKDGPYGTAIQAEKLAEKDYRGDLDLSRDQKGNNDLLNLTRPGIFRKICDSFG
jgi:5-methyltetrahydrofolate--homocysteine methyltransferase